MSDIQIKKNDTHSFSAIVSVREGERTRTSGLSPWKYVIAVANQSGVVNDSAVVLVDGRHIIAPHGETPIGQGLGFIIGPCLAIVIDSDAYTEGTHTVQARTKVLKHERHFDVWKLEVTFTVSSVLFADSITNLEARITAEHVTKEPPKEEPKNPAKEIDRDDLEDIIEKYKEWQKSLEKAEQDNKQ